MLQHHEIVSPLCDDHLHVISKSALPDVLTLTDHDNFDPFLLEVLHCALDTVQVEKTGLAKHFTTEAEAKILTIDDTTQQVVLHKQFAVWIPNLLCGPQVVVVGWIQVSAQGNGVCRCERADRQGLTRINMIESPKNNLVAVSLLHTCGP